MNKPRFSEFQLQQLANFEIIMKSYFKTGTFYFPFIPNLVEEKKRGYDTGFYFPWLHIPGDPSHRGCNFFIQYKLSTEIIGKSAPQYKSWNAAYFKFNIPYRNKRGGRFDDYFQFQRLRRLAKKYRTYYATNQILSFTQMIALVSTLDLLNEVPFLNVSHIHRQHKTVTFTQSSTHFKLHSETNEIAIQKWSDIQKEIKDSEKTTLSEDLAFLREFITDIEKKYQISGEDSFQYRTSNIDDLQDEKKFFYKIILTSMYLKRYVNVNWFIF